MKLATICYIKKDGMTLMLDRSKKEHDFQRGVWNAPGGKVREGETLKQCVLREVEEETGLIIVNPIFLGIITYFGEDIEDWHLAIYTTNEFSGEMREGSAEGKPAWMHDEKLLSLKLWPGDKYLLPWIEQAIKEEKIFFASMTYDEQRNVIKHDVVFQ